MPFTLLPGRGEGRKREGREKGCLLSSLFLFFHLSVAM
jgi:hypothetical protein